METGDFQYKYIIAIIVVWSATLSFISYNMFTSRVNIRRIVRVATVFIVQ